ncbi:ATP-binding protein [Chloroflexota bacterium]
MYRDPRCRPPDETTKPEPWVCPECGHRREATWNMWEHKWTLWDGPCDRCDALQLGREWLIEQQEASLERYGLNKGVRAHMTLDNYIPDPRYPSQALALQAVRKLVTRWRNGDWAAGIMLLGRSVGVGKTHLAISAVREGLLLYRPRKLGCIVSIWSVPTLLDDIKDTYNNGGPTHITEAVKTSGILLLDDLGAEHYSSESWYRDILYDIFNARWEDQLATIVTTNLEPAQLRTRVGPRVLSRLLSLTGKPVLLTGADYRLNDFRLG